MMDKINQHLLEKRMIFINEEFDNELARNVCKQLHYLSSIDDKEDITLYINSPGGTASSGLAIYDTMNYISNDVRTIGMGRACSMGAFLLSFGTKGKRSAFANTEIMVHQLWAGYRGTSSDIQISVEQHNKVEKKIYSLFCKHTGKSVDQIKSALDRDNWMTPKEAKKFGIIDKII